MLLRCTKNGHLSYYERWNCETCSWLPLIALGPSNCRKYQKIMSKDTLGNRCISSWAHVAWLWMILKLFVYSVNLGGPIGWFGQWSRGCMFVSQWIGNFELELMPILWLRYWQCGKSKALGEHRVFRFWKGVLIKYDYVHSRHLQTRYSSYDAPIVGHQTRILEG